MDDRTALGILAALAFLPPVLYLFWVRSRERNGREPVRTVLALFLYGGTAGIAIALVLNVLFGLGLGEPTTLRASFLGIVVAAPFIEELAKGLGLGIGRRHLDELEDGLVHGTAIGLGFAATENLVYSLDALQTDGLSLALQTAVARVFSSMLLHAGSTALLGFGYGLMVRRGGVVVEVLPYYLVAVVLHASYNFLVLTQEWLGFALAVTLVVVVTGWIRSRIRALDALPSGAS